MTPTTGPGELFHPCDQPGCIPAGDEVALHSRAEIAYALDLIRTRFERPSNPDDVMPFHNVDHTRGVVRRTGVLMRAMEVPPLEYALGLLAAAFHDVVQRWEENRTPDGKVLRKRFAGQNETDSAAEGIAWMRANGPFEERHFALVTEAIMGTVPSWDPQNKTVSQPKVANDAHPVVRAVAMADLGIPGMDGAKDFIETGDALFREENLDVARTLRNWSSNPLGDAVIEAYKARIVGWCKGQVFYARGRQARLEMELGDLIGGHRAAVKAAFGKFDDAIAGTERVAAEREAMPAWDVVRATGYVVG